MALKVNTFSSEYWQQFTISKADSEFIYNYLLDKEIPLASEAISLALIADRIQREQAASSKDKSVAEIIYKPKETFSVGDTIVFPSLAWEHGNVISVRNGVNPEITGLQVIEVEFEDSVIRNYAANYEEHALNAEQNQRSFKNINIESIFKEYGNKIITELEQFLSTNDDFVRIAGFWFPRSLVVDVHVGHLNLVEAILEENKGGPLSTKALMLQVDFKSNTNENLLEFSFNLALQEDSRFDEVGPAGETLWYLKALEPEDVRVIPEFLIQSSPPSTDQRIKGLIQQFEGVESDELELSDVNEETSNSLKISLLYPHWRSGTLPLTRNLKQLFPTAYESARIRFDFIDAESNQCFQGWVVRNGNYVSGLIDWYQKHELIPGSLVSVWKGDKPGQILINAQKSRQNKEWLKTVLIGTDQALVLALLKQPVSVEFNERMVFMITDVDALDIVRANTVTRKESLERTIIKMMRELGKLNPQGHVHAQELYAAVNLIRRAPPSAVLEKVISEPQISHLGDLYFRLTDSSEVNTV